MCFGQRTELWWDHPIITSFEWKRDVWDIPADVYARNLAMVTDLLDLKEILHTFARELSLGQRMRADLGMLLLHSPSVVFLDEPTLGLDVLAKQQMIAFLRRINREEGVTIVVTSHDMDDLEAMGTAHRASAKRRNRLRRGFRRAAPCGGRICPHSRARIGDAPAVSGAAYLSTQGGVHEYAFDRTQVGVHDLLASLAGYAQIEDVEIGKAPIEDIIAGMYREWKGEKR